MVTQPTTREIKEQHRRMTRKQRAKLFQQREERRQWAITEAQHRRLDREFDARIGRG